jgi:hypothetical protein
MDTGRRVPANSAVERSVDWGRSELRGNLEEERTPEEASSGVGGVAFSPDLRDIHGN